MIQQALTLAQHAVKVGDVDTARAAAEVLAHCVFIICRDLREVR